MFDVPTVLVLGAGASYGHGYPLGASLIRCVRNLAQAIQSKNPYYSSLSSTQQLLFTQEEIRAIRLRLDQLSAEDVDNSLLSRESHKEFMELLDRDHSVGSIDAFLQHEDSHIADIGRLYIALELLGRTYPQTQFQEKFHDSRANRFIFHGVQFADLFPISQVMRANDPAIDQKNFGWYGSLVSVIRNQCNSSKEMESNNQLDIVTFNYEKSLEIFLRDQLPRKFKHKDVNVDNVLNVHHIYGAVPEIEHSALNDRPTTLINYALNCYQDLGLIGERASLKSIEITKDLIARAQRVVFVGFAFDPLNTELLGFPNSLEGKELYCHNYSNGSPNYLWNLDQFLSWQAMSTKSSHRIRYDHLLNRHMYDQEISDAVEAGLFGTK